MQHLCSTYGHRLTSARSYALNYPNKDGRSKAMDTTTDGASPPPPPPRGPGPATGALPTQQREKENALFTTRSWIAYPPLGQPTTGGTQVSALQFQQRLRESEDTIRSTQ